MPYPIDNPDVQRVFDNYADTTRQKLLTLRQLILDVASETRGVGTIEETLKWGQISYLTHRPKSGTTLRIDAFHPDSDQIACFVHCQTTLIDTFRQMHPHAFTYDGTRALIWEDDLTDTQHDILKNFIHHALTYHQRK